MITYKMQRPFIKSASHVKSARPLFSFDPKNGIILVIEGASYGKHIRFHAS